MTPIKLKDRIESYQESADYKLLSKLPVIICVNGRSFSKITSLIDKPYCNLFAEGMSSTMLKLCIELEGILFAYQFNDEIVLISRNDQNQETAPWYDNKIQKISSITSSIATLHFNNFASSHDLNLMNSSLFTSQVFVVPNIAEAINTLVYKQQCNFYTSIQLACFYELLKKYDKNIIKEMLNGLSIDEKIDILSQECNIDFNQYPAAFRRGVAAYKVPKVINEVMKNKWIINTELPIFTKEQSFLSNIFKNGADIFRKGSF
jgi:tRNA(His) 5'-end guanylyltransferase